MCIKFTKNDISDPQLKSYLLRNITPISHRQEKGHLVCVYGSDIAIELIEIKILKYKNDGRYNKWVNLWENHIKILKGLK